ncbi:hypothetical protein FRC17_005245 [Serendipita sp. 399]|nr:hypothetical protein FRC17_005245 [Serendipita sp. 399]
MDTLQNNPFSLEYGPGEDKDVQLMSSDGVVFHVQRYLLAHTSPVFKDMFLVGNGPLQIAVSEDSKTLAHFLRFFDPTKEIQRMQVKDAIPLLEAARKYQVQHIFKWWAKGILGKGRVPTDEAMDCLALALRHNLHRAAGIAFESAIGAPESELQSTLPITDHEILNQLIKLRAERKDGIFKLLHEGLTLRKE